VAGDARLVGGDGSAGSDEAVEQGGLTHVGTADNRDEGKEWFQAYCGFRVGGIIRHPLARIAGSILNGYADSHRSSITTMQISKYGCLSSRMLHRVQRAERNLVKVAGIIRTSCL